MKKIITFSLFFYVAINCLDAQTFELNGIAYSVISSTEPYTVEVINRSYPGYYSGNIVIPEFITFDTKVYSVVSIGSSAFFSSMAISVTIPNSVTNIGSYAFYTNYELTSVILGNSVAVIGDEAFTECSMLSTITIPNSVNSLGLAPFSYCYNLTSINVDPDNQNYASVNGVLYNKNITTLIKFPNGQSSIEIPNSVTLIEEKAFAGCTELNSVNIPNSITVIGDYSFAQCTGLISVTLGNSVTTINNHAFYDCRELNSFEIPNSVITIGDYAFSQCKGLTSLIIGNSVKTIGNNAFENCIGLQSVTIPNSVFSILDQAFVSCAGLTSVTIGNSVETIGVAAFGLCSSLQAIILPNSVTAIGLGAFSDCPLLSSIIIPGSVITIGDIAFRNCTGLVSIGCYAIVPPLLGSDVFLNVPKTVHLCVLSESEIYYQATNQWKDFAISALPLNAGAISGANSVCKALTIVTYSIPEIANATSYFWTLPDGSTGTSSTNTIEVTFGPSAISGDILVRGVNDCGQGRESTLYINLIDKPITPTIVLNGNVLLSDALTGNQWYYQNELIAGATNQYYIANSEGRYYVIVTRLGCNSDQSNIINYITTGLEDSQIKSHSKVFPNPVSGELYIEIEGINEVSSLILYNSIGEIILRDNFEEKTSIQTSNLSPGVYLIRLKNSNILEFKKLIKQ